MDGCFAGRNPVPKPDSLPRSAADYTPHIDGGGEEDGWRVSPQPVPIQASTILGAAGTPGCGGTLVWPGMHRAMAREYLRSGAVTPHTAACSVCTFSATQTLDLSCVYVVTAYSQRSQKV